MASSPRLVAWMRRRTARGLAVGLAATLMASGLRALPAAAHETGGTVTPVVDGLEPPVAGVTAVVQSSQDATLLSLRVEGNHVAEVLDDDGQAWVRIDTDGVVADVASPAFRAATNAAGSLGVDRAPIDPWPVVADEPRFTWFEHRLHPAGFVVPPEVQRGGEEVDLSVWRVPIRVDGQDVEITGRLVHVPVQGAVVARLVSDRQVAPDVTVDVAPGSVPSILVTNGSDAPVVVLGRDGAPFAVLDAAGTQVNEASATWHDQLRYAGTDPSTAGDGFTSVSTTATYAWLESRASLPGLVPSREVRNGGQERQLLSWRIELEVGQQPIAVDGETVWVPLAAPEGTPQERARPERVVAIVIAVILVGFAVRRRLGARATVDDQSRGGGS